MKMHSKTQFLHLVDRESMAIIEDVEFTECEFNNCSLSLTTIPDLCSTVRRALFRNCTSFNSDIGPALLEDVLVDNFAVNDMLIVFGALFRRVTLTGDLGAIKVNRMSRTDCGMEHQLDFEERRAEFYASGEWALDIRDAKFRTVFECEGIPCHLIRRDPETQVVVQRDDLPVGWENALSSNNSYWREVLSSFLADDESEILLVAPKLARKSRFKQLYDGIEELRRCGYVRPE